MRCNPLFKKNLGLKIKIWHRIQVESSQRLRLKDLLSVPKEDASVEQVEVTLLDAGQGWSGRITGRCNVV